MNVDPREQLSEYLDGSLSPAERAAVEAHLLVSEESAALLEQLRSVRSHAGNLPPLTPADDLWTGIESRLGGAERTTAAPIDLGAERARRERAAQRWSFTLPQLAAAVFAIMLVSAGAMWLALGRGPEPIAQQMVPGRDSSTGAPLAVSQAPPAADAIPTPGAAVTPGTSSVPVLSRRRPAPGTEVAAAGFGSENYDVAILELSTVLEQHKHELDPATVQVVEKNLALIDQAIEQARRALAADPASSYLNGHLASTMRRKVDLLRRVTSAVRS